MGICTSKKVSSEKHTIKKINEREIGMETMLSLQNFKEGEKKEGSLFEFKNELLEIPFSDLKVDKCIGRGGSSAFVYKAEWKGKIVAFKCFKSEMTPDGANFGEFEREAEVHASVVNPNILKLFGVTLKPPRVGIVMEYCLYGDLEYFLKENDKMITFPTRIKLATQITNGMEFIHMKNIIHRDLKLSNILVDGQMNAKLMDFGLSRVVDRISITKTKNIGTAIYMAPEVASDDREYNQKCDVYSFGIVMFQIFTNKLKPYGNKDHNIQYRVKDDPNFRPPIEDIDNEGYVPVEERDMIKALIQTSWSHDPSTREGFHSLRRELEKIQNRNPEDTEYTLDTTENDTEKEVEQEVITISPEPEPEENKLELEFLLAGKEERKKAKLGKLTLKELKETASKTLDVEESKIDLINKVIKVEPWSVRMISKDSTVAKLVNGTLLEVRLISEE